PGALPKRPYVPQEPLTRGQKVKRWFRKYFLEGNIPKWQKKRRLSSSIAGKSHMGGFDLHKVQEIRRDAHSVRPHAGISLIILKTVWWMVAIRHNFFQWYPDYWHMPVTMILGSFVGGMTSEGSGAVAFPVMTLALHIAPSIARDFSLMIQSCGMTSALMCVMFMKIDPLFNGPQKKMMFVAIWTAFAIALGILNSQKRRKTYKEIPDFCTWKAIVLFITGFVGGVFDAFAGSGVDICIFSIITLLFRVTEKTATPTTVVLK
ncbi:hypothetical protein OSTOST_13536, partial [Ostertagia ostertagi]